MKRLLKIIAIVFLILSVLTILSIVFLEEKTINGFDMTFHDAMLINLMLFGAGEPLNLDVHNLNVITGILVVAQTVLGLATLTIAFGAIANFLMSEKIAKLMSKETLQMQDHVILCGLGNVGYRVVEELERLQQPMVILDRGDEKDYIELVKKRGHKVLIENLKDESALDEANINTAKSIIICTGNDLLNMEIALNARAKREDIIIVLRMFDQKLAEKVSGPFNIKVAFSSSSLAAPVFAAASFDRSVLRSVSIGQELFVTAQIDVAPGRGLVGMTVTELLEKDMSILKLRSDGERIKFPTGSRVIKGGDTLFITCSLETLKEIKKLNGE